MAKRNIKRLTIEGVLVAAALSASLVWLIFLGPIQAAEDEILRAETLRDQSLALLARKSSLEAEWEARKRFIQPSRDADAALNAWVRELLGHAQSQSLVMEKLEPAGIQSVPQGKKLKILVAFKSDARRFLKWLYRLTELDPLSQVDSFRLRQEEGSRVFGFELLLSRTVS